MVRRNNMSKTDLADWPPRREVHPLQYSHNGIVDSLKQSMGSKREAWNSPSDHARGGTCSFPNMKADAGCPDSNLPCNAAAIRLVPDPLLRS